MTKLSPAAQAVLTAFAKASDGEYIDGEWQQDDVGQLAAALRAVADQVVPEEPLHGGDQRWEWERDARQASRIEQLEAQANHSPGATKMVPVATDEELLGIWDRAYDIRQALRAIYDLGVEHGQVGSREVAEPAPVAGETAELVADLRKMAYWAESGDDETLTRAANTLQQLVSRRHGND
jgi:hypothetical protein